MSQTNGEGIAEMNRQSKAGEPPTCSSPKGVTAKSEASGNLPVSSPDLHADTPLLRVDWSSYAGPLGVAEMLDLVERHHVSVHIEVRWCPGDGLSPARVEPDEGQGDDQSNSWGFYLLTAVEHYSQMVYVDACGAYTASSLRFFLFNAIEFFARHGLRVTRVIKGWQFGGESPLPGLPVQ
jgi:hypothetical protein